jgi:NodT family efflux transporter outer membrane factor (OMF) lipoprotein
MFLPPTSAMTAVRCCAAAPLRALAPALLAVGLATLGGCAADPSLGPHDTMPTQQELATQLQLVAPPAAAAATSTWWTVYQDAQLNGWIEKGLADSPSLREAGARVARAQAYFESARAAQGPSLGFGADINQQRISSNGIFPPPLAGLVATVDDIGLSGSIDFDLFGRLAARTDAARLGAAAGAADHELARIRLAAAIGQAYFELARMQQTRRILIELEQSRTQMFDLVRRRVAAGFDTQVERRLAEVPVPQIRVDIERSAEQIELARHSLALLAGQGPQAADGLDAHLPEGSVLVPPQALPLDLLARRADVAAAQTRVKAALRNVDAARAEFYPNVNLTALIGLDALSTQMLFQRSSRTWQIEPAIHLPLFDSGLLRANLRAASAETDEAIAAYKSAVLQAAQEAANALTSIASVQRQQEQQALATQSAQAAADLAAIRYQAGLGNLLAVLSAQASVLTQRRAQLDLDARAASLNVSLALALGGGFGAEGPATESTKPSTNQTPQPTDQRTPSGADALAPTSAELRQPNLTQTESTRAESLQAESTPH